MVLPIARVGGGSKAGRLNASAKVVGRANGSHAGVLCHQAMAYYLTMKRVSHEMTTMMTPLEDRVATLERQMAELTLDRTRRSSSRDWRAWYGASKDDPGFDEMIELGREYRERENKKDDVDADVGA